MNPQTGVEVTADFGGVEAGLQGLQRQFDQLSQRTTTVIGDLGNKLDASLGKVAKSSELTRVEMVTLQSAVGKAFDAIAAGANPVRALAMEAGHLPGAFGGAGAALEKLGGLLTPLRLLLGGFAAAIGSVAYAAYEGDKDVRAFNDALRLTGGYAGVTRGQYDELAESMAEKLNVSIGKSREVLLATVKTGQFSREMLESVGAATLRLQKLTGASADEIIKDFAGMSGGVAKWAEEHNKTYHFISAAQIEHIRKLEESGHAAQGQRIAMDALTVALSKNQEQLGFFPWLYDSAAQGASRFWNAMKGIGKDDSVEDQLKTAERALEIAKKTKEINARHGMGDPDHDAAVILATEQRVAKLRAEVTRTQSEVDRQASDDRKQQAASVGANVLRQIKQEVDGRSAATREVEKYKQAIKDMAAAGMKVPSASEQAADIAAINAKHKTPGQASGIAELEAQLSAEKSAFQERNNMRQMSLTDELAWWDKVKNKAGLTSAEKLQIAKKESELRVGILKEGFDAEIASLKAQENQYQHNYAAKLALAQQEADMIKQRYGVESKEFAEAQGHILQIKRQSVEQQRQIDEAKRAADQSAREAVVTEMQAQTQYQLELGIITHEQELEAQRIYEQQFYQIKYQALQDKLQLAMNDPDRNPVELQKLHQQIEELERSHAQRMTQIQRQVRLEQTQNYRSFADGAANSFGNMLQAMLQRQMTFSQAMRNLWHMLYQEFLQNMVIKPFVQWLAMALKQMAIKLGLMQAETTAQTAQSATTMATKATEATAVVGSNAAEAASGAAASASSIPYIGWILAGVAFAAVLAMTLGARSSIKSAAGGYDIPSGTNPMLQAHEEEMVLPKDIANPLRDAINGDGLGSQAGAAAGGDVHYHDYSGRLSKQQIRDNVRIIADELNRLHGSGWRPSR